MAKRILSLVISVALLLGCVSGLTLISGAASTVVAADLTPSAFDNGQGAYYSGTFGGFNVWGWQKIGWFSWNNGRFANALGVAGGTVVDSLSISFDYYWDKGETDSDNNWWQFKTTNEDGTGTEGDGFSTFLNQGMAGGAWNEVTVTRERQMLGQGDDLFINVGDLNNSKLYVRGVKVVATIGEDTYTALWGSYCVAKIDFTSGVAVGKGMAISGTPATAIEEITADSGDYGMKMTTHNQGFNFTVDNVGISGDVAVTVEYFMASENVDNNTSFNMSFNGANHILRVQGATLDSTLNGPGDDLTKDANAAYTFVVSGDDAAALADGETINTMLWNDFEGNYYFIKSISIMSASLLATAPADPGYKYYDFVESYAKNPYYPAYTTPMSYGVGLAIGGNGTQAYYSVTTDASDVMIKFTMKEDATATGLSIDYQTTTEGDGWKVTNGVTADVVDGVATYVFDNAVFQNGLNGLGSFRMSVENASQVARVEVYEKEDLTALNDAITAAKAVDTTGKTSYTIAALNAAIATAEKVAANEWATAADITAAIDAMTAAAAALKAIPDVAYDSALGHIAFDHFEGTYQDEGSNIAFTDQGEWFEYEVNVTAAGLYNINIDMATGNAASTVEVQDGNGRVYGSFVVASEGWSGYKTYTVTTALQAGVQKLRIVFKESSANYRGLTLSDARYIMTNVTGFQDWSLGEIVLFDGSYAWKFSTEGEGVNKGLSLLGYTGVLNDSTSVVYEIEVQFETNPEQPVGGFSAFYGTTEQQVQENVYAVNMTDAVSQWGTYVINVDNWSAANCYANTPLTMFGHPGAAGDNVYIRSFKAYDAEDPTKEVSIVFAQLGDKTELQAAVDAAIEDLSGYTTSSAEAYTAALNNAKAVLADELALQAAIDAALAALNAATEGLAKITDYSSMSFEGGVMNNVNSGMNHNHPDEDDTEGNGIFEVAPESGIYGIKLSQQNRGFGYAIQNSADWLAEGQPVQLVIKYYAPSAVVQDNSRIGVQFEGDSWYRLRVGATDDASITASGLVKDEVGTVIITLSEADAAKVLANQSFNFFFWNYNDDAATGGDYIYIVEARLEKAPDNSALQAAVDNAIEDLSNYTEASAKAYTEALKAAKAVLVVVATQDEIDAALAELEAAAAALMIGYAEITFENDTVNTVNGNILHNHPDEDDGDADNGIYEVIPESGIYGIKLSVQNHGFGFGINNNTGWLNTDTDIKLTVTYYAPGTVVQDNTRMPFQITGNGWNTARVGESADAAISGLTKDEIASFTYTLTADEAAAIVANGGNVFVHFWNYNDNPETGGDYIYVTGVRVQNAWSIDKTDLQAAVDAAIEDLSGYTEDSAAAYTAALEAAQAVLASDEATAEDVKAALDTLNAATAALVARVADLVIESITTTGGDIPKIGDKVAFVITVKNNGNAPVAEGAKFGGIVKINDTLVAWSDNYKTTDTAPALNPGETITLTTCGGPDGADGTWTVVEGEFTVYAMVNDGGEIVESDSTNNELTITMKGTNLDLAALNAAIAEVEAMNLSKYTEDSVAALNEALAAAKAAIAKADATQAEIDAAKAALDAAKAALVDKDAEPVQGLLGDVNGDTVVNSTDARDILKYAAELFESTELDLTVADVSGDGVVNTTDAREILKFAAEIITEFPAAAK